MSRIAAGSSYEVGDVSMAREGGGIFSLRKKRELTNFEFCECEKVLQDDYFVPS